MAGERFSVAVVGIAMRRYIELVSRNARWFIGVSRLLLGYWRDMNKPAETVVSDFGKNG